MTRNMLLLVLIVVVGPLVLAGQADTTRAAPRLYQIRVNQQGGYIDATGRVIIPPRFDEAGDFAEGLAPALVEGKWGFIDATGTASGVTSITRGRGSSNRSFSPTETSRRAWVWWRPPANPTPTATPGCRRSVSQTSTATSTVLAGS
ncbi:MAG: hypothetical protein DMD58_04020 [Gemmatimonadetes bacterium]|nr:MAG: hypothetical protein DMD58_04020 [Gemmatimonadota bacterium]